MKQKFIYIVLLAIGMYFPASSEECSAIFKTVTPSSGINLVVKPAMAAEEVTTLPLSLFSKLVVKL